MTTVENGCGPTETPTDIDIDALRDKYRAEREKRLRKEGSKQYIETTGQYAGFAEADPHTLDGLVDAVVAGLAARPGAPRRS